MSVDVVDLDGADWHLREAIGDTWQWYLDAPDGPAWRPATVPGSVVTDLTRTGELPDPYRARNSRAAEWTGTRHWVYRREVHLAGPDGPTTVELDGIDPLGTVFWDGREIARASGMYDRVRAAVPDAAPGAHRLAVVVAPVAPAEPQVGRTDRVRTHRPRFNAGWDFCPPFPHQGLWRSARLVRGTPQVSAVAVHASLDKRGDGAVRLTATVHADGPVQLRVTVRGADGAIVAETLARACGEIELCAGVERPELWWPNGFGAQARYEVCLWADQDALWQGHVGFRTAVLAPNAAAPAGALRYTALVNDVVVPLLGWNWVPADAQYGAAPAAKVRHLVQLAAASGARLLRVWGGGLIESDVFYDACDEAGLLVWQEFSQSSSGLSSVPAADEEFVATLCAAADAVVPPLVRHPSLFAWCGGNELHDDGVPLDERTAPALAALRERVRALDAGRPWLPTSPSGPVFAFRDGGHDVHGPWEHQGLREQQRCYDSGRSLAHTEFGAEGMTNARSLERLVPAEQRWPADRSSPVYRHLGEWWNNATLVQEAFGSQLTDVDGLRRASQWLQATGLAYAVEADRRRWPVCSMVLPWQLHESYPNAWCTSSVDHRGDPKPAYHAVARAFAPRRLTIRVPTTAWAGENELRAEAWLWSQRPVPGGTTVLARLRDVTGAVLAERSWPVAEEVSVPRPSGSLVVEAAGLPDIVVWDLVWSDGDGCELDREQAIATPGADLAGLLDLDRAEVSADETTVDGRAAVVVAHRGGPLVVGLEVLDARPFDAPGWVIPSGDPRPLLPGQCRTFAIGTRDAQEQWPLLVTAWNVVPTEVEPRSTAA